MKCQAEDNAEDDDDAGAKRPPDPHAAFSFVMFFSFMP